MFQPDWTASAVASIDWTYLARCGYKLIMLDIDNTLAPHGTEEASPANRELIFKISQNGMKAVIISNAKSKRALDFAASLGVPVILGANKPCTKASRSFLREQAINPDCAVMVGDQIFTDIWFAQNLQCGSVLVKPLTDEEPFQIRLKRKLERIVCGRFENIVPKRGSWR